MLFEIHSKFATLQPFDNNKVASNSAGQAFVLRLSSEAQLESFGLHALLLQTKGMSAFESVACSWCKHRAIQPVVEPGLQVLRVRSCVAHSHAAKVLKDGDLVLAVNGQPVTSYGHVESIVAACSLAAQDPSVTPSHPKTPINADAERAGVLHELDDEAQPLTDTTEQLDKAAIVRDETQHDDDSSMLIRAARPNSPGAGPAHVLAETRRDALAMPQVSVTICRGSKVEEVEVQLGSEGGLGTGRLIHWCGAMFQVSPRCTTLLLEPFCHTSVLLPSCMA